MNNVPKYREYQKPMITVPSENLRLPTAEELPDSKESQAYSYFSLNANIASKCESINKHCSR
jgi:hypothetical protein